MRTSVRKYWTLVSGARVSESGLCTNVHGFLVGNHTFNGCSESAARIGGSLGGADGDAHYSKITPARDRACEHSLEFQTEHNARCAPRTRNARDSGQKRCG